MPTEHTLVNYIEPKYCVVTSFNKSQLSLDDQ